MADARRPRQVSAAKISNPPEKRKRSAGNMRAYFGEAYGIFPIFVIGVRKKFVIFANGNRLKMKQHIINKLRKFFSLQPIEKAWVFGSYSRGEETKDSDVDILVRFDSHAHITLFKYAGMVEALSDLLHRRVDLVEEGQLKDFAASSAERWSLPRSKPCGAVRR